MAPRKKPKLGPAAPATNDGRRVVRRRRGSLQDLPEYALEIQLEVFSHLHPRDLLSLTRTCKKFRSFFLHRSNEPLWKAARQSIDNLPDRPAFLSEPAFAHLMFATCCHHCGQSNVRKGLWSWCVRYCKKCIIDMSYSFYTGHAMVRQIDPEHSSVELESSQHIFSVYWTPETFDEKGKSAKSRLHKPEVDAYIESLTKLPQPITNSARQKLIEDRLADMSAKHEFEKACETWEWHQESERLRNLKVKKKERFAEILERLRALGWGEDIDFMTPQQLAHMSDMPVVRQSSKLTPSTWTKVLQAVDGVLNKIRTRRIQKEEWDALRPGFMALQEAILSHCVQIPRTAAMDIRPEYVDLAMMDECRNIINSTDATIISAEHFADIVPALVERWMTEKRQEFVKLVTPHLGFVPSEDVDVTKLAIAVVPCSRCDLGSCGFWRFPEVLSHTCGRKDRYILDDSGTIDSKEPYLRAAYRRGLGPHREWKTWHPFDWTGFQDISEVADTIKYMRKLLVLLGLDPNTATVDDLQQIDDARLRCLACDSHAHTWESALSHACDFMNCYPFDFLPLDHSRFERIDADDLDGVAEREAHIHNTNPTPATKNTVWACSLCPDWDGKKLEVLEHLAAKHEIDYSEECIENGTIYLHTGKTTLVRRPPVPLSSSTLVDAPWLTPDADWLAPFGLGHITPPDLDFLF